MVLIGYNNYIPLDKILVVLVSTKSEKQRRLRLVKEQEQKLMDATEGHKSRSLLILFDGLVVISAIAAETIGERMQEARRLRELGK